MNYFHVSLSQLLYHLTEQKVIDNVASHRVDDAPMYEDYKVDVDYEPIYVM